METVNPNVSDQINQAWQLRFAGRINETSALIEDPHFTKTLTNATNDDLANYWLLLASLDRYKTNHKQAQQHLQKVEKLLNIISKPSKFQFYFQSALCFDAKSDFANSLNNYQRAFELSSSAVEQLMCKVNLAIARNHLGLPLNGLFEELTKLVTHVGDHPVKNAFHQIEHLLLKQNFWEGKDTELAKAKQSDGLSQKLYFLAWCAELPWLKLQFPNTTKNFIEACFSSNELFNKNYRLQTITSDQRLETLHAEHTVQSQIDRLFLWTFRWLQSPEQISQLLANELADFDFKNCYREMCNEDFWQMQSLGGWLSLYNTSFSSMFQNWLQKYLPNNLGGQPRFFQLDKKVRTSILENNWQEFYPLAIKQFPEFLSYLEFINSLPKEDKPAVINSLCLQVFVDEGKLQYGEHFESSTPLAKLAYLLTKQGKLSFAEVLQECFGIYSFDPISHTPKINNLIQRFKKYFTDKSLIFTRNQIVYANLLSSHLVLRQASSLHIHFPQFPLPSFSGTNSLALQKNLQQNTSYKTVVLEQFVKKQTLSRQEIQSCLRLSKASTNRWIENEIKTGFLKKYGTGRSSTYSLK